MAYTAVPTVATGDLWTAANHNTYIRDNFAAGVPDIFTTKGDLAVGTAANAASRLGVGSNGYSLEALSSEATGLVWRGAIFVEAARTTTQSINSGTPTIVAYDAETDPGGYFTTGAAAKFTCPIAGIYLFHARAGWSDYVPAVSDVMVLYFYGNGALWRTVDSVRAVQSANAWRPMTQGTFIFNMAAADYIDVRVEQNTGSAKTLSGTFNSFYACRIK